MGYVVAHIHKTCIVSSASISGSEENVIEDKIEEDENEVEKKNETEDRSEVKNLTQLMRTRDSLLDIIVERTHDVSYYTRSAVLKVWISLLESNSVPVRRIGTVGEIAVDRLFDKTASVRKNAVALLTALLENNPFSGNLNVSSFQKRKAELDAACKARVEILRANAATAPAGSDLSVINEEEEEDEEESDVEVEEDNTEKKKKTSKKSINKGDDKQEVDDEEEDEFLDSADVKEDSEIIAIRAHLEHCEGGLELIAAITAAVPKIEEMLRSKTAGDVVEALRFFTRAVNFSVKGSAKSLRGAFSLVWHNEVSIKAEILSAFRSVYLTDGAANGEAMALPPSEVANNLVELAKRCDASEIASFERIIGEIFQQGLVEQGVISSLWSRVSNKINNINSSVSIGSVLHVISMIAKCIPDTITPSKARLVVQASLTSEAIKWKDFSAIRAGSQCLQACPPFVAASGARSSPEMNQVYSTAAPGLRDVMIGAFCGDDESLTRNWFGACEEAMHALFHIHPCPDKVLGSVIAPLYQSLTGVQQNGESSAGLILSSAPRLSRFQFLLGQGALCSVVFTERLASAAKKASDKDAKESNLRPAVVKGGGKGKGKEEGEGEADAMEEEMGMAAAADAEHERMLLMVTERQLVFENLLGKFHPLLAFVVANENNVFSNLLVRETAVLALCRYMCVSCYICESYLALLFTVLTRDPSEKIRTTIAVALGDLAFRFPNALEPWTAHMYARLGDECVCVRYNTLMVLTHLILNDMVKVKGQVSHVVCCLTDKHECVRDLASLFFLQLSERSNNPVYNLLGDIIASLSAVSDETPDSVLSDIPSTEIEAMDATLRHRTLSQAEFETTMVFLLSFVQRDKQADALVERLCVRMGAATSLRKRRCLAFCVGELTVSDKGIRKVVDNFRLIKDALYDQLIHSHFKSMLAKVNLNLFILK